jgi:3-phenylpropionate/cinnamic acid dioxygenase small subunit
VLSSFVVRQARKLRDEAWWVGRRRDRVRRVDGAWRITRREVCLDATILPKRISIFF